MELKRRFIFHGDAIALGGRIVRPKDLFLDSNCASTLPVTGGRTTSQVRGKRFENYLRFGSASTLAEGKYDDRKALVAVTEGNGSLSGLVATTTVRAEVTELIVGSTKGFKEPQPQLTIKRVRGSMISRSPESPDGETSVSLGADTSIDGAAVDGHRLIIELNKTLFQEHDTFSKLRRVASDPAFVEANATSFMVGAALDGKPQRGLIEIRGICYGTLVRSIRWAGKPHPRVTIDGHVLKIENLGRVHVGEILIGRDTRRVTMLRFEFGSPWGGDGGACDFQDNGIWGS